VGNGGGIDQGHGDLELVSRRYARDRVRERVQAPAKRDDPAVSPEMVKRLQEVGILEAYPLPQLPGAVRREDSVSLGSEEPNELDSNL